MLQKFRYEIARFMTGRYGVDQFSRFLGFICFILVVVSLFLRSSVISFIIIAIIIYMYFRILSRNIPKRYAENQKYLALENRVRGFFSRSGRRLKDLKTHHIYLCPQCRQKIRVPRGKGRIEITCPKCRNKFIKRS